MKQENKQNNLLRIVPAVAKKIGEKSVTAACYGG